MEQVLVSFIQSLVSEYPIAVTIFAVIGVLRAINKPLFALFRAYVKSTASTSDDAFLDKVEASPIVKAIVFFLDWTTSIKIPEKKTEVIILPKGNQ